MPDLEKLIEGLKNGDRLSLSKCITLIENEAESQQTLKYRLIEEIEKFSVPGFRIAVTGVPGAGKSTLIDQLGLNWIEMGHKVAVLAIDPSSSISLGSIMGDKTRMTELSKSEMAFVRPSPTRLQLGGVAAHTFETIKVCEAAGFDRIIIETVGVGQSETLVSQLVDNVLLVLVSGTGDELQGVKKGILESADFVFVNKADGINEKSAQMYAKELNGISALWPERGNGEKATVLSGSCITKDGLKELIDKLEQFFVAILKNGSYLEKRKTQSILWMESMFYQRFYSMILQKLEVKKILDIAKSEVMTGNTTISAQVGELLQLLQSKLNQPETGN